MSITTEASVKGCETVVRARPPAGATSPQVRVLRVLPIERGAGRIEVAR